MVGFGWLRSVQKAIFKNTARMAVAFLGTTGAASAAASRSHPWKNFTARAAEAEEEAAPGGEEDNSLESLAREIEDEEATKLVKPCVSYEDLEGSFQSTYVDTFEGMRMIVQKQVNMNTAVSHFYWIGSSQVPPYYHYTLTLVDQLSGAHCRAQTQDFTSVTGALGAKISEKVEVASDYGLTDKGNTYTATLNLKGLGDSRSHLSFQNAFDPSYAGAMFSAAFMQAVSKTLSFGGQGMYIAHQGVLVNSYAGMYDDGENCFAVQQGGAQTKFKAMYRRVVNPNRVTLATGLTVDAEDNTTMCVSAEYGFKQSTLKMSVDSGLMLKTTLVGQPSPGMQFTLAAEVQQAKEHFKFGYSIMMG